MPADADPVLVLRRSPGGRALQIMRWALAGSILVAVVVLFVNWHLAFIPLLIGGVFGVVFLLGAQQRRGSPVPRLVIDRDGIQMGSDPSERIPWDAIAATRFFRAKLEEKGWSFGVEVSDPALFSALADPMARAEAQVTGRPEISVALAELDGGRVEIRRAVQHYRPEVVPAQAG